MSDPTDNGVAAPAPTPAQEQGEQLRAVFVAQIVQQTQQLLALVGVSVNDPAQLHVAATEQLDAQQALLAQVIPTLQDPAAIAQNPLFGVQFQKLGASVLLLPGQPPPQPFAIVGPKRLTQQSSSTDVGATLLAISCMLNPALRLAASILGTQVNFAQAPITRSPTNLKHWKGMAKR